MPARALCVERRAYAIDAHAFDGASRRGRGAAPTLNLTVTLTRALALTLTLALALTTDPDPNQVEAQLAALQRGPAGVEACWAYISPKNGNREGDQAALRFESVLTNNLFYEPLLGCSTWKVENTEPWP
jgi:hypothetical protein